MDRLKISTKNNRTKYVKRKLETIQLSINSSSLSSTSKTTSYTEEGNEYDPNLQYDEWELKALMSQKKNFEIKDFFNDRKERQNFLEVPRLILENKLINKKDNISYNRQDNPKSKKILLRRQDSIIISRNRMEKKRISGNLSNIKIESFSLPSSPRESNKEIYKFNFSSSDEESSDMDIYKKRTFSDRNIPKSKKEKSIKRSSSSKFKKKKWHSNLRITSMSINSPRKRQIIKDFEDKSINKG